MSEEGRLDFADEQIALFVKAMQAASDGVGDASQANGEHARFGEWLASELSEALDGVIPTLKAALCYAVARPLHEYAAELGNSVLAVAPVSGSKSPVIVRMSAMALDCLVASALGGAPARSKNEARPVSRIELAIARVIACMIFSRLDLTFTKKGWSLKCDEVAVGSEPENIRRLPAGQMLTVVSVKVAHENALLDVAVSQDIAKAISAQDEEGAPAEESFAQGKSASIDEDGGRQTALPPVKIGLSAILCEDLIALDDILDWSLGESILLSVTTQAPVQLVANDVALFSAELGRMNGWMCVQIADAALEAGSELDAFRGR